MKKALLMAAALAIPVAASAQQPGNTGSTQTGRKTNTPSQTTNQEPYGTQPEAGTLDESQSGTLSGSKSGSAIGQKDQFSAQRVVDKLHHVNKKHIEYGNLARTRGSSEQVRKFGAKLVKDHQRLDDAVITYATANRITLGGSQKELQGRSNIGYGGDRADDMTTAGSKQGSTGSTGGQGSTYGTGSDSVAQAGRNDSAGVTGQSGAMGGSGQDKAGSENEYEAGTGTAGSTQRANDVGRREEQRAEDPGGAMVDARQGRSGEGASSRSNTDVSSGGTYGEQGTTTAQGGDKSPEQKRQEFQAKLDELKNLQGAEFDGQFLSNVVDASQRSLERLNGWKGQGDKKLNVLIDRAIKVIGDHQREAERLQQKIPAA